MKKQLTWKMRRIRGRIRLFWTGLRYGDLRFALTARPIMGADDPPAGDPPAGDPPAGDPPKKDPSEANKLGEERRLRKKAEKEAAEAKARADELEGKDATDLEKERKAKEKAEADKAEAEQRVKVLERGGWVRAAATTLRAVDADAVVALIDLDAAESEDEALTLVKELVESKPALFGQRSEGGDPPPGTPPGFGTPAGGDPAGGGAPAGGVPGIGKDGAVDQEAVRSTLGKGLLGLMRGRGQEAAPGGGQPEHEED